MFTADYQILDKKSNSQFLKQSSNFINSEDWQTSKELYTKIFNKGRSIIKKYGSATSLIFVILKCLKTIKVECARVLQGNPELEEQASNLLFADPEDGWQYVKREDLQEFLTEAITELKFELKEAMNVIKEIGAATILNDDVVMTYGFSDVICGILETAWDSGTRFSVLVLEGNPHQGAVRTVSRLAHRNIPVTLTPDRASFTLMSRTTKLLLEAATGFVDGAIQCRPGIHRLCLDAKEHAVPVFMCLKSSDLSPFVSCVSRKPLLTDCEPTEQSDIVPGSFVTSLIMNLGILNCSQLLGLARDCFCTDDVQSLLETGNQ